MKSLLSFLLFFLLALLGQGLIRHLPLVSVRVDLVFLMTISLGFFVPLFPGAVAVFLIGLAAESVGAPLHGLLPLSYLSTYLFLRMTHDKLFLEGAWAQAIWVSILSLTEKGIESGLLCGQGYEVSFDFVRQVGSALLQGMVSLWLFPFLKKVWRIA